MSKFLQNLFSDPVPVQDGCSRSDSDESEEPEPVLVLPELPEQVGGESDDDGSSSSGSESSEDLENDPAKRLKKLLATIGNSKHDKDKEDPEMKELEKRKKRLELEWDLKSFEAQHETLEKKLELSKKRDLLRLQGEIDELEHRQKKQRISSEYDYAKQRVHSELDYLRLQIERKEKEQEWKDWVDGEPEYHLDPVRRDPKTGEVELIMSDRVIDLDEIITYHTADKVTERIQYYNNQSAEFPIFLVIDYSLGGSVIAGYRIQKAIDASPAPIYVIVKSFAASMAASIASMADHSFIYPNGIMMHHQIICGYRGNLTQIQEGVDELREWWRRLAGPLAKKLGISLDEWIRMMYEHNSDGDWEEFGDKAVELGWIDSVVHRLRQTGFIRHPDWKSREDNFFRMPIPFPLPFPSRTGEDDSSSNNERSGPPYRRQRNRSTTRYHPYLTDREWPTLGVKRQREDDSRRLPQLKPKDHWWLYNPNGYYQV